jgi:cation:H+ antiporter
MTLVSLAQTLGGFLLLFGSGELLLRGAVSLARIFGLSPLLIGLTVVAAATSMPELMVTVTAGLGGLTDVGVGNAVGSNIANILLILGAAAVIHPIPTHPRMVRRDAGAVLIATALFAGFGVTGPLGWVHGAIMLALLGFYLWFSYWNEVANVSLDEQAGAKEDLAGLGWTPAGVRLALVTVVAGAGGLVLGSDLLVEGAVTIARAAGISESVIGLTLIALGTSLPELATAVTAARHRHTALALGNALGSNIFNILLVLGALVLIAPVQLAAEVLRFDLWVMVGVTVLLIPIMMSGWRISRLEGMLFLALYAAYIGIQFAP